MPILFNPNKKKGVFMIPTGGTQAISCAFSYSASSYTDADPDPTPTVTGTSGGTFTSTAGIVINADTGEIDLSASTLNTYVVTYTVGAKACTQSVEITASFSNTKSLAFDGVDDYINGGNISALNGVTTATWSGWFNRAGAGSFYIMSTYGAGQIQFFVLQSATAMTVYMANSVGTQQTMNTISYSFSVDTWYNLAFVYNEAEGSNADKMKVYVNGVLQTNTVAGAALTTLNSSTANFEIGKLGSYTTNEFNGKIDEVAIWNTTLSASDVSDIFSATSTGKTADLSELATPPIAWYRMGD